MEDPDATIINPDYKFDVDDILRKYGIRSTETQQPSSSKSPKKNIQVHNLSDSDNDQPTTKKSPISKTTKKPSKSPQSTTNKRRNLQVYNLSDSDNDSDTNDKSPTNSSKPAAKKTSPRKQTTTRKSPNAKTRADPLAAALRKQEAENKKQEAAKHKEIKKLLSEANKQLKPDECLKFVTAFIDENITNLNVDIENAFKELGSNYAIKSQLIPNTITWTRNVISHEMDDNSGVLKPITTIEEQSDLLLILKAEELFKFIKDNNLMQHIKTIESIFTNKSVSLGVLHLEIQKKSLERKFRLSSDDIMNALVEIQVFCNCCYRNLDDVEDLSALISQFTKAIAQRPYKLQQQEKYAATNWYMKGDNKDCVKVDKKGNGLKRLWQQQITSFPLARLEIAESIIEKYPTKQSLLEAYDFCVNKERENLLADIPVRRNAGPITSSRRIGIEMSKKISTFYNSLDGDATIN